MNNLVKIKWFTLGVVVCALLSSMIIPAVAAGRKQQATLEFSDIKITMNGQPVVPKDANGKVVEPFTIDGTTYLPVRGIAGALGLNVNWDEKTSTVQLSSGGAPAASASYSQANPAPVGVTQTLAFDGYMGVFTAEVRVTEIIRGDAAYKRIMDANKFNDPPDAGYEYVLINARLTARNVKSTYGISVGEGNFDPYSENNEEYVRYLSVVDPEPQFGATLNEGETTEGWMSFMVRTSDKAPKVQFGANFDGTGGLWFKLSN